MENQVTKQNEQTTRACPKDCRKCSWQQQVFCSAQLSFNAFGLVNGVYSHLVQIEEGLKSLSAILDKFNSDNGFISPSSPECPSSPFNPNKEEKADGSLIPTESAE